MSSTSVDRLRLVAFLEGVSFLLLLGVAMPLKYLASLPIAVRIVGAVHGVLFLLFCLLLVLVMRERRWSLGRGAAGLLASLIPFGTFIIDARFKRWGSE